MVCCHALVSAMTPGWSNGSVLRAIGQILGFRMPSHVLPESAQVPMVIQHHRSSGHASGSQRRPEQNGRIRKLAWLPQGVGQQKSAQGNQADGQNHPKVSIEFHIYPFEAAQDVAYYGSVGQPQKIKNQIEGCGSLSAIGSKKNGKGEVLVNLAVTLGFSFIAVLWGENIHA